VRSMAAIRQLHESRARDGVAQAGEVTSPDKEVDIPARVDQLVLPAQEGPDDACSVESTKRFCEFRVQIESPLW